MARTKRKVNPVQPAPAPVVSQQRIYNTGGYVRLSVEDSGRPGADTIAMQEELISSYIEAQPDMRFCGLYSDNGRTGTNFERPAFERLMDDVRNGKINCIVVKDLSRFGRNYLEADNYLERVFPFLNVRFVAVNDNFDTLTAERSADGYIVPLKNILNDAYSKDISRKICPALATKQQNGEFIGSWAAYGYRRCADDHHRIEPEEETAPVVREMFQWRLEGMSYAQITRRLNEKEIPSPARYHFLKGDAKSQRYANTKWSIDAVKKILANEVYLGHMVQGRKRSALSEGQKQRLVPKSEWVIVRDTHAPLIDEETFRTVQQMGKERRDAYHGRLGCHDKLGATPNILRRLIYCPDCNRPLVRYKSVTNKGTNLYYVYICPSHATDPASCPKKYIHEAQLKEILWDTLQREIALAGNMERLVREYGRSKGAVSQEQTLEREAIAAQQAYDRSSRLHDSLFQNYADNLMTEREYMEMKRQYRADMERAKQRLEDVKQRRQSVEQQTAKNPWLTSFRRYREESELTEEMAHTLIERVEVDADNRVSITLRFRDEYRELLLLLTEAGKAVPA